MIVVLVKGHKCCVFVGTSQWSICAFFFFFPQGKAAIFSEELQTLIQVYITKKQNKKKPN